MNPTQEIIDIVNRVPDLDGQGTVHGVTWDASIPTYDAVLTKGRDGVLQVVGMLAEVDDGTDYKPRYLLHATAVYLCRPGKEDTRQMFCEALASQLGGDLDKSIQGYLIRQLQVAGGKESVAALGAQLLDEGCWDYAAQALLSIGGGAEHFRAALKEATSKSMIPQILTATHALATLKDAASKAAFLDLLNFKGDAEIPLLAAWALANIGDASAADALLAFADAQQPGWSRNRATSHCLLLAENTSDKSAAQNIYRHLEKSRTSPDEEYIRDVARDLLGSP